MEKFAEELDIKNERLKKESDVASNKLSLETEKGDLDGILSSDDIETFNSDLLITDSELDSETEAVVSLHESVEHFLENASSLGDTERLSLLNTNEVVSGLDEGTLSDTRERFYHRIKDISLDDLNEERKKLIELGLLDE